MSESSNEQTGHDSPADNPGDNTADSTAETPEVGLIADEQLPEDLQPDKNPLAADPDDQPDDGGSEEPQVDGLPDMGQPGA